VEPSWLVKSKYCNRVCGQAHKPAVYSKHQESFRIDRRFGANMFDPALPVSAKKIKAQTVLIRVHDCQQLRAQSRPLGRVQQAFKDRKLYPLPPILAMAGYLPEPPAPLQVLRIYIIAD
jgi:hypothetical protein